MTPRGEPAPGQGGLHDVLEPPIEVPSATTMGDRGRLEGLEPGPRLEPGRPFQQPGELRPCLPGIRPAIDGRVLGQEIHHADVEGEGPSAAGGAAGRRGRTAPKKSPAAFTSSMGMR